MLERNEGLGQGFAYPERVWEIDNGWDVYGADGAKVGEVEDVQPHYLVVGKGLLFHTQRYIPVDAVANVENGRVYLNVSAQVVEREGWDQIPAVSNREFAEPRRDVDHEFETGAGTDRVIDHDRWRIPRVEEEMDIRKREVRQGAIHVHKGVVDETRAIDVPLREEHVRVERHRSDHGYPTDEIPADAFQDIEIVIPIRAEEVRVSKRPVVREEVDIVKVVRERDRRFTETLRREDIQIERDH